jgi:hypothetical protein
MHLLLIETDLAKNLIKAQLSVHAQGYVLCSDTFGLMARYTADADIFIVFYVLNRSLPFG